MEAGATPHKLVTVHELMKSEKGKRKLSLRASFFLTSPAGFVHLSVRRNDFWLQKLSWIA